MLNPQKDLPMLAAAQMPIWAMVLSDDIVFRFTTEHVNADGFSSLLVVGISSPAITLELLEPDIRHCVPLGFSSPFDDVLISQILPACILWLRNVCKGKLS